MKAPILGSTVHAPRLETAPGCTDKAEERRVASSHFGDIDHRWEIDDKARSIARDAGSDLGAIVYTDATGSSRVSVALPKDLSERITSDNAGKLAEIVGDFLVALHKEFDL